MSEQIECINISEYLNTNYREYAIYTLEHRGIPSFDDSLTNVQRLILLNCPTQLTSTLSLVGDVIKNGYFHGDSSLSQAINRLAKLYQLSYPILEGSGFFGNVIKNDAAQPRYTKIKLNSDISQIINRYKHINELNDSGYYENINISFPIGLLTTILGISVGYQTKILPRKYEEIVKFLNNRKADLTPYFHNFNGKITQYQSLKNVWLIEPTVDVDVKAKTIHIKGIPPLMKYDTFVKKLNSILFEENVSIKMFSQDDVNILIKINDNWQILHDKILNSVKLIVKENIIFIHHRKILEYESVENYLIDFKMKNLLLEHKHKLWTISHLSDEVLYNEAKLNFYKFMFQKKRNQIEIKEYLDSYPKSISNRLDNIKLTKLNVDEIDIISQNIDNLKNDIKGLQQIVDKFDLTEKDLIFHTISDNNVVQLFDLSNKSEINNIEVFQLNIEEENGDIDASGTD